MYAMILSCLFTVIGPETGVFETPVGIADLRCNPQNVGRFVVTFKNGKQFVIKIALGENLDVDDDVVIPTAYFARLFPGLITVPEWRITQKKTLYASRAVEWTIFEAPSFEGILPDGFENDEHAREVLGEEQFMQACKVAEQKARAEWHSQYTKICGDGEILSGIQITIIHYLGDNPVSSETFVLDLESHTIWKFQ